MSCWWISFSYFLVFASLRLTKCLESETDIFENECFLDDEHFKNCIEIIVTNITTAVNSTGNSENIINKRKPLMYDFIEENCEIEGKAKLHDIILWSSKEGDLIVEGKLTSQVPLKSPLKIKTVMHRKLLGFWIKIGCIKEYFGSCSVEDVCNYGSPGSTEEECPPLLQELDLPCRCPIESGSYVLPGGQIKMPTTYWSWILSGHYTFKAEISSENDDILCYKANFELV